MIFIYFSKKPTLCNMEEEKRQSCGYEVESCKTKIFHYMPDGYFETVRSNHFQVFLSFLSDVIHMYLFPIFSREKVKTMHFWCTVTSVKTMKVADGITKPSIVQLFHGKPCWEQL